MVLFITLHKVILTVKFVGKSRALAWVTIQMKAAGQFLYVELFIMPYTKCLQLKSLSINYYCVIIQMQAAKSFFFSGGTVHHAVNKVVRTQKSKRDSSQIKAEHVEQRFLVVLQSVSEISIKVCRWNPSVCKRLYESWRTVLSYGAVHCSLLCQSVCNYLL